MKSVWSAWPSLSKRIFSRRQKLLLVDFDGTLVPIAKSPQKIVLKKKVKDVLKNLSSRKDYHIFVISGRSLADLRKWLKYPGLGLIGNHGFEIKPLAKRLPAEVRKASRLKTLVWLMGQTFEETFSDIPGIVVEDKNYTLSLHFRNVPANLMPLFSSKLKNLKKRYGHLPLQWCEGKKIWEVRPKTEWGKGKAACYLFKKYPESLPIIIGDDRTDEDMFKALKNKAITIHVGRSKQSAANYQLNSSREVCIFLQELSLNR